MGTETGKQVHVARDAGQLTFLKGNISNDKPRSKISAFDGLKDTPRAYLTPCPGELEDLNTRFRRFYFESQESGGK